VFLNSIGKYAFWILSRAGLAIYSRCPIFGTLRVALGVIRDQDSFLMIERNDGRGVSFPGGIAMPWESTEQTAQREILEETGLRVTKSVLKLHYFSSREIPVDVSVFEVETDGQLRDSWEGTPRWLGLSEISQRVLLSQKRIVEAYLNPESSNR
jgi:8-oxo-dGTP pyrophosphatase MutT (NUDIX family)